MQIYGVLFTPLAASPQGVAMYALLLKLCVTLYIRGPATVQRFQSREVEWAGGGGLILTVRVFPVTNYYRQSCHIFISLGGVVCMLHV